MLAPSNRLNMTYTNEKLDSGSFRDNGMSGIGIRRSELHKKGHFVNSGIIEHQIKTHLKRDMHD